MYLDKQQSFSFLGISIWGIAVLFFLYEFFLRVFIGTLADQIIPALGLTAATFSLIGAGYHVTYGLMQIPVGLLVDRFGVKWILAFAVLTCSLSVFLFSMSNGVVSALLSRLLMGFGSSFAFVCLLMIISTWFNRKNFAFIVGLSQFIATLGPLLAGGPLVNLLVQSNGNWRLLLNKIGLAGLVLFVSVLLVVKSNANRSFDKLVILKPRISISAILRQLVTSSQVWFIAFYSAAVYVPISVLGGIWGTSYLESHHLSQIQSASIISTNWLGYAVGCVGLGLFSDKSKRRKSTFIFCSLIGFVSIMGIVYTPINPIWIYHFLFFGLGIAASGQNIGFAAMAEHVTQSRASSMGLNNAFIVLLNAVVQLTIGVIISLVNSKGGNPSTHDFLIGFAVLPILYLSAFIISVFLISETYCKPRKEMIILKPVLVSTS